MRNWKRWLYPLSVGAAGLLPLIISTGLWILARPLLETWTSWGWAGQLPFTLMTALVMGLALSPTTLVAIATGYLWGWPGIPAMLLAYLLAALIGRGAGVLLSRGLFPEGWLRQDRVKNLITRIEKRPVRTLIFARLSPALPFAMTNLVLGNMHIPLGVYIGATLLGMLPRSLISFGVGVYAEDLWAFMSGSVERSGWEVSVIVILLLISVWGLYRIFFPGKSVSTPSSE